MGHTGVRGTSSAAGLRWRPVATGDEELEGWIETRLGWQRPRPREADWVGYPAKGVELRAIERLVPLDGQAVVELGCGDGRLTLQYAPCARRVDALDANRREIALATAAARHDGLTHVRFRALPVQRWRPPARAYDVAFFSNSL